MRYPREDKDNFGIEEVAWKSTTPAGLNVSKSHVGNGIIFAMVPIFHFHWHNFEWCWVNLIILLCFLSLKTWTYTVFLWVILKSYSIFRLRQQPTSGDGVHLEWKFPLRGFLGTFYQGMKWTSKWISSKFQLFTFSSRLVWFLPTAPSLSRQRLLGV